MLYRLMHYVQYIHNIKVKLYLSSSKSFKSKCILVNMQINSAQHSKI